MPSGLPAPVTRATRPSRRMVTGSASGAGWSASADPPGRCHGCAGPARTAHVPSRSAATRVSRHAAILPAADRPGNAAPGRGCSGLRTPGYPDGAPACRRRRPDDAIPRRPVVGTTRRAPGQQSSPPADPTLADAAARSRSQPTSADPYAPGQHPYAGTPATRTAACQPPTRTHARGYPPAGLPAATATRAAAQTNGMAIAALVLVAGRPRAPASPRRSARSSATSRASRSGRRGEGGEGMAKAGIIVGWIVTGLLALLIVALRRHHRHRDRHRRRPAASSGY